MTAPPPHPDAPDPQAGRPAGPTGPTAATGEGPPTKGERTRRRLLELAVAQFGQHGFRATSVTDITRSAGLTQAASYAYFQSKAALFREAVDTDVAALIDSTRHHILHTPMEQLLVAMLVQLIDELDAHPLAVRVLGGNEPEAVATLRELPAIVEVRALLAARISRAQASGEVRADVDPERLATGIQLVLVALLTSMTVAQGSHGDASTTARVAEQPEVIAGVVEVLDALLRMPRSDSSPR